MEAAVWNGDKDLRLQKVPIPNTTPGSILVEVKACAVCGSDLRIYDEGNIRIKAPRILGHEISGKVVEVGKGVNKFKEGDHVSIGADVPCGKCAHCLSGRPNCCDVNLAIGYQFDGGFAQFIRLDPIVVKLGPVAKISNTTSFPEASLSEPLACCLNGYERALMSKGNSVAIFGGGPIGAMLAMLGSELGASKVIIIEPNEIRRNAILNLGADLALDPNDTNPVEALMEVTSGNGVDTLFTACPISETHNQAIDAVAKRGVINFFGGLPKSSPPINILSNHIHYREAYITGSHGSTPTQHRKAVKLIEEHKIDIGKLIGATTPLSEIHNAFVSARTGQTMKVVICPN